MDRILRFVRVENTPLPFIRRDRFKGLNEESLCTEEREREREIVGP